jgi:hypothetical protein
MNEPEVEVQSSDIEPHSPDSPVPENVQHVVE